MKSSLDAHTGRRHCPKSTPKTSGPNHQHSPLRSAFAALTLFILVTANCSAADKPAKTLHVFLLAGQSNMEGQAVSDLSGRDYNEGRGTLMALLQNPATAKLAQTWRQPDGSWTRRSDVWCWYQREERPLLAGPLSMGFSVYGDSHHFGPELEFGRVLGDALDEPVLLVKTAWGGKSLAVDFRPPSAGGQTGKYYSLMIQHLHSILKPEQITADLPELAGLQPVLAGFVWYHGWNDGVDPQKAVPEYESNLIHLINDLRREFKTPQLPVVIGELTGPWVEAPGSWDTLRKAQASAANHPAFRGTAVFVPTHDFVRPKEESPNPGHGHHEFGNAETYLLTGKALGTGMLQLLQPANAPKPGQ